MNFTEYLANIREEETLSNLAKSSIATGRKRKDYTN